MIVKAICPMCGSEHKTKVKYFKDGGEKLRLYCLRCRRFVNGNNPLKIQLKRKRRSNNAFTH